MQVIILAAGRGTRFGKLTEKTPKSLLKVNGKPILEYTLSSLPSQIKEIHIVIGHLGNQIIGHFGNNYAGRKINYITSAELNGTGGAVWQARPFLKKGWFLVLNGDDIYWKNELTALVKNENWSTGLARTIPQNSSYFTFELDKKSNVTGARY